MSRKPVRIGIWNPTYVQTPLAPLPIARFSHQMHVSLVHHQLLSSAHPLTRRRILAHFLCIKLAVVFLTSEDIAELLPSSPNGLIGRRGLPLS